VYRFGHFFLFFIGSVCIEDALEPFFELKEKQELRDDFIQDFFDIIHDGIYEPAGTGHGYGLKEEAEDKLVKLIDSRIDSFKKAHND
jgi:hypothetical protein